MKHLTASQVLQFVDTSADYATMAFCTNHLAVCEQCRRQVEIQRSLSKSVRRLPLAQTSSRFADSVMTFVHPSIQGRLFGKVLNNLGAVFGLLMVVSAGGLLYDMATKFEALPDAASAPASRQVLQSFQDLSKRIAEQGSEISKAIPIESAWKFFSSINTPILWSGIMVLALLVFDQFFSKQAIRNIRRLKPLQ